MLCACVLAVLNMDPVNLHWEGESCTSTEYLYFCFFSSNPSDYTQQECDMKCSELIYLSGECSKSGIHPTAEGLLRLCVALKSF